MDLSKLKIVIFLAIVVGGIWLLSAGGVNFLHGKFTENEPGVDEERDKNDEKGLTRIAGYFSRTFRYEQALEVYQETVDRYPGGENVWFNYYRMVRCMEKLEMWEDAARYLALLRDQDASEFDMRVPEYSVLHLRYQKIDEVYELGNPHPEGSMNY